MLIENYSLGVDIEENKRFENKTLENDEKFLKKIFTKTELDYCFSIKNPHQHLCARYCAKEAAVKAFYALGIENVYYSDVEIKKKENGVPFIEVKKYPQANIKVSLSHSENYSTATVIIYL